MYSCYLRLTAPACDIATLRGVASRCAVFFAPHRRALPQRYVSVRVADLPFLASAQDTPQTNDAGWGPRTHRPARHLQPPGAADRGCRSPPARRRGRRGRGGRRRRRIEVSPSARVVAVSDVAFPYSCADAPPTASCAAAAAVSKLASAVVEEEAEVEVRSAGIEAVAMAPSSGCRRTMGSVTAPWELRLDPARPRFRVVAARLHPRRWGGYRRRGRRPPPPGLLDPGAQEADELPRHERY
jgi:hypothetical protein